MPSSSDLTQLFDLFSIELIAYLYVVTAEQLWKGCTSVSNAGMKRGRGRGVNKRNIRDLNKGQVIGVGRANIVWPGLNAPVIAGKERVQHEKRPENPEW